MKMDMNIGPDFDKLEAFIGRWRVTGAAHDGSKDTPAVGDESFEWIEGRLAYTWNRHIHESRLSGRGTIFYDHKTGKYFVDSFDNEGYARVYELKIGDKELLLEGTNERARISIDETQKLHEHWELNRNGEWRPLCDLVGQPLRA